MTAAPDTESSAAVSPAGTAQVVAERFGAAIVEQTSFRGEHTVVVEKSVLLDVLQFLRDERGFDHLCDLTAVDHLDRQPRFDVVYQLFSYSSHVWFRLKVRVDDHESTPSAVRLWPGANWPEREVWDLFGIVFDGHPNLVRIMLPEGWVGHPLRKDYPISQITLPRAGATKIPE